MTEGCGYTAWMGWCHNSKCGFESLEPVEPPRPCPVCGEPMQQTPSQAQLVVMRERGLVWDHDPGPNEDQ